MTDALRSFVRESNRIEGIHRAPSRAEIEAHRLFLSLPVPIVADLERFVGVVAPGHVLRRQLGLDVRVGNHVAPPGGDDVEAAAERILIKAMAGETTPWETHCLYEDLHPFTDGNGRSGRVLWLWQMNRRRGAPLGFLHHFYYQTLAERRR